jgi:hypothetical protein
MHEKGRTSKLSSISLVISVSTVMVGYKCVIIGGTFKPAPSVSKEG